MRLLSLTTLLFFVATLSGCKDTKQEALDIIDNAKKGKKPSTKDVNIVYKQLKKEGSKLTEAEVAELLNLHAAVRNETDPVKRIEMFKRMHFLVSKMN